MEDFEIVVKYDKELQEVHIYNESYSSCTYCNIKTKEEIADSVKDFIESYEVE